MKAEKRREEILSLIGNAENPIPANVLADKFAVSRQVIVQDIAIIRANGYDVTATNRGYVLNIKKQAARVFRSIKPLLLSRLHNLTAAATPGTS